MPMSVSKSFAEGLGLSMGCILGIVAAIGQLVIGCCGVFIFVGLIGARAGTAKSEVASSPATPRGDLQALQGKWNQSNGHRVWQFEFQGDTLIERTDYRAAHGG